MYGHWRLNRPQLIISEGPINSNNSRILANELNFCMGAVYRTWYAACYLHLYNTFCEFFLVQAIDKFISTKLLPRYISFLGILVQNWFETSVDHT